MAVTDFAKQYHEKMFPGRKSGFMETDPEFTERFENFAFDEVINMPLPEGVECIDNRTRFMAWLAALIGCGGMDEFCYMVPASLRMGVSPAEVKEITYQAAAYLGMGRALPFLRAVNEIFADIGIAVPLEKQGTTTQENRREAGTEAQVSIFGEGMRDFWKSGPEEIRHINHWLADNCFGDYYTRKGLSLAEREMITFCFLMAQGGCETQLAAHAKGNVLVGNDQNYLIQIVSQCLPFIGYPRSLNALKIIQDLKE